MPTCASARATDTIRDGQKALKIIDKESGNWLLRKGLHICLAKAYALKNQHKDCAEQLEAAGLDKGERKAMRALPAFENFLTSRYAEVLN